MSAAAMISELRERGIRLSADGGKLHVSAPKGVVTDALKGELRRRKGELLAALAVPANDAAPTGNDPTAWRAFFDTEHRRRLQLEYSDGEARALAYGACVSTWHSTHANPDRSICAGCGKLFDSRERLELGDGARVHFADYDCLVEYGRKWRGRAEEALKLMQVGERKWAK